MITQAIMRIMSEPHALHACTVTSAKALAGSTHGIRDYFYFIFLIFILHTSLKTMAKGVWVKWTPFKEIHRSVCDTADFDPLPSIRMRYAAYSQV